MWINGQNEGTADNATSLWQYVAREQVFEN